MTTEKKKELRMDRPIDWSISPPLPHNMLMELANICNHNCVFCGYKDMKRPKRRCDKKLMFNIMEQAYDGGTREIGFYMIGEPLICPDLVDYVSHAHSLGYEYIYLTTNGALATLDRMKELISAGLNSIKFSVNGASRETYKLVHGVDDFLVVRENISALRHYIGTQNVDLNMFISFIRNELNKHEVDLLYSSFGGIVDKIYVFDCNNQAGGRQELIDRGVVKAESLKPQGNYPCEMVFNQLHITCEGFLGACCSDCNGYLSAVDLKETPLLEAWNAPVMVELRRKHLTKSLENELCFNCVNLADITPVPLNERLVFGGTNGKETEQ